MQAVHRHACTCSQSHGTHAASCPFAARSFGNGHHGCAQRSLIYWSLFVGPTYNADPPTSPQMRSFPPKQEAENIHTISHVLLCQFFSSSIGELLGFCQSDTRLVKLNKQFPQHVKGSILDPEHSFVTVHKTALN